MVSEETPLVEENYDDEYIEIDDYSCLPQSIKRNRFLKFCLYFLSSILTLAILYLLVVILPNIAPEGIEIPAIQLVKTPDYYLHPLIPKKSNDKYQDPDNPNKPIPNFNQWDYIPESDPIFKSYWKKLTKLNPTLKNVKKRLILIGDVHGCLTPLNKMLSSINYDKDEDHVILLGDFIDKGPHSLPVLDFAIENDIDCVLGNHELEILKRYAQFHAVNPPLFNNKTISAKESYDLDEMMKIAKRLTIDHINYLSKCSPIQSIGPVQHLHKKKYLSPLNGVAVHGGLMWNKNLNEQSVDDVTSIRNLLPPNWDVATDDRKDKVNGVKSKSWSKIWNEKQTEFIKNHLDDVKDDQLTLGTKVFYGHDAKRGVNTQEFSQGLDSGCVYGKRLTGMIMWSQISLQGDVIYKNQLLEVNC